MEAKIGQQITVTEDFEIQSALGQNKIVVKKGDKGFVDVNGLVHYETGEARGKIQGFEDLTVKGYDTENISKMIYEKLNRKFGLGEHLENYDYETKDVIDEIDWLLSEIF